MLRINLWCSPRNLSTALMYSWRQRADTTVVDEPLYAFYLERSGRIHPGRDEVLASQSVDPAQVLETVMLGDYPTPVVFFKQMAKHLLDLDRSFLSSFTNVLLTRDPRDMLISFQKGVPDTNLDDTGLVELVELLEWMEQGDQEPVVIESRRLLQDPERVLTALCQRLGLTFDHAMLTWPAGPKPEDGVWGDHWYQAARSSTGFAPWTPNTQPLAPRLEPVLEAAKPLYERLAAYAL